jgi:hypothetical protein
MSLMSIDSTSANDYSLHTTSPASISWPATLAAPPSGLLRQMFRDPRVLEPSERKDLVAQLRNALDIEPGVTEIRVLLGMALCVDLQPQEALEHLRQAARQAPDCFIARLKFGELLMRLRICGQAAEETHAAAVLASNDLQADLARKQAATIRVMLREGIERGGYLGLLDRLTPRRGKSKRSKGTPMLVGSK